jgi:hypothetical protein
VQASSTSTVVSEPLARPMGGGSYPGAAAPAVARSPYPPTVPFAAISAQLPAGQAGPTRGAPVAQGAPLQSAESGSGPSMAGFATQAPRPASTKRGAVIGGIVVFALVFGVVSSVLVYRSFVGARSGTHTESAAPSATATEQPAPTTAEPGATASVEATPGDSAAPSVAASSGEPAPDAGGYAEPSGSASVAAGGSKGKLPGPSPSASATTSTKTKTRPIATTLDVEPRPKPTGKDFGF